MKLSYAMVALALMSGVAQADTIGGIYLGADYQFADVSGGFGNNGGQQDFSFDDDNVGSVYAKLEHPLPLIPNLRLHYSKLSGIGATNLSRTLVFGGQQFDVASLVDQELALKTAEATFYYEILDNDLASLDLGVTAKFIKGDMAVMNKEDGIRGEQHLEALVPMFYGYGSFGLLGTGVELFAEINYANYDGSSLSDARFGLAYELVDIPAFDCQLQLGVKRTQLTLDDVDHIDADVSFKGAFAGIQLHF